ncbi:endonuclease domain-containing protein [Bacteroidota bacterium]
MSRNNAFNQRRNSLWRKKLRSNSTSSEILFWMRIKGKKVGGLKFRRQYAIGKYSADFYCHSVKLAIELDGPSHRSERSKEKDTVRDMYFESLGITVFRIPNYDAIDKFENIKKQILAHANQ